MTKIININPLVRHENAEYFLNIYHDVYLEQDEDVGTINKTLRSLVGHFYVGFASKLDGSDKTFGKRSIEDGNLITDGTAIIGRGRVVDENSRLSLSKKYQAEKGEQVVDTRVIPLTANQYFNSYQFAKVSEQDNNHLYVAGGYDCADFVQSVYHAAGLSFHFTKCYTA